jgi:hypothetical protein
MATPKKPWPRGAEWARVDAIALLDDIIATVKEGDALAVLDLARRAKEKLTAAGNISADADPLEDPTLREYITSVVEEKVKQILKQREESQHHGTEES